MPIELKSQDQLVKEMMDYVAAHSDLTDFNVGSVIRTVLEAAAMNDAELYLQLAMLRQLQNIDLVRGNDLDERAAEYNLSRRPPQRSLAKTIKLGDSGVSEKIENTLAVALVAGTPVTSVTLTDGSDFPNTGYLIFDRDNSARERFQYTARVGNVFTVAFTPTKAHAIGASVILSQQGADHTVPAGTIVVASQTADADEVKFSLNTDITLYDGDVYSDYVEAYSLITGTDSNVAEGRIDSFASNPWSTATVVNDTGSSGGLPIETDDDLRSRVKNRRSQQGGVRFAVESAALLCKTADLKYYCQAIQYLESINRTDPAYLYVHDGNTGSGTDFATTEDISGIEVLLSAPAAGALRCRTLNWPLVASSLQLRKAVAGAGVTTHGFGSAGVGGTTTLTDTSKAWTPNVWAGYYLVDSNGDVFEIASNSSTAITTAAGNPASGNYGIFNPAGAALTQGTDFVVNETSGELQLNSGLSAYQMLVAHDFTGVVPGYSYFTGLIQIVQKTINGDPSDFTTYPGIGAAGCIIRVLPPTIATADVTVAISVEDGVAESTSLRNQVADTITAYIAGLQIGQEFVLAQVISRCQQVPGVKDTTIVTPTSNMTMLPGHLFRAGVLMVR